MKFEEETSFKHFEVSIKFLKYVKGVVEQKVSRRVRK